MRLAPQAVRDLTRIPPTLRSRLSARIDRLATAPRSPGAEKLTGTHRYRARVGDYRIIYEIDDAARVVSVDRIGHRRDVYRDLG